ncbi:hypothetical protein [Methylobacterium sp. Leaf93]|uniref:hypothetical protein n=1 Tax=Methylobacterium sp. Leaf93 TaxID=1736249 RepID=UPI000701014D|nr:hypothetical protein [Methylobacterium sp. Leaf93]KQP02628.1 hypothetical protein ASF26_14460 [Methylobacterium sp. Leaf93]
MIPHSIQPKLIKLLPLLGSDNDGEVVSTVWAIGRTLASAGADFHDLTDSLVKARVVIPPRPAGEAFNYADVYRQAARDGGDDFHPAGRSRRFGLPLWHPDETLPWWEVARECLHLNRILAKRDGERFLRPFEVDLLERFLHQELWPTNAQASWVETVVARCHQARDAAKRKRPEA